MLKLLRRIVNIMIYKTALNNTTKTKTVMSITMYNNLSMNNVKMKKNNEKITENVIKTPITHLK